MESATKLHQKKPVIGLCGGVASGKSYVAEEMELLGGMVIDSDALGHQVLNSSEILNWLTQKWGAEAVDNEGKANRHWLSEKVFQHPEHRRALEAMVHPRVAALRNDLIQQNQDNPAVTAFVISTALLFETCLDKQCDAIVFIDTPKDIRLVRAMTQRGWDKTELERREKSQMALDRKRISAHYILDNSKGKTEVRRTIRTIFSQIINPD